MAASPAGSRLIRGALAPFALLIALGGCAEQAATERPRRDAGARRVGDATLPIEDLGAIPATGCRDLDGDGYGQGPDCLGRDCDDADPAVHPGALEHCNGRDDDCDGVADNVVAAPDCALRQGVCAGARQVCAGGEWLECLGPASYGMDHQPVETLCDGLDNDCDGFVDEGCPCAAGVVQICGSGEGECRTGQQVCDLSGAWGPCDGERGPQVEICNGRDDDCDGRIDEGLDASAPNCARGLGVCAGAQATCRGPGGYAACGVDEYGPQWAAEEGAAHCDGLDNDCDGLVDEGCGCQDGAEQGCGVEVGTCEPGVQICRRGRWGECLGATEPRAEICDGADNDCDGRTDEGLVGPPCAQQSGVCAGATQRCGGGAGWLACDLARLGAHTPAYVPVETEAHCDRLDNDCDGRVDEACECVDGSAQPCGRNVGQCTQGQQRCELGSFGACSGAGPTAEICDGVDNDCDGAVDEGVTGPPCPLQVGSCAGSRQRCVGGRFAACGAEEYGPLYQMNETFCDERDNDCDGRTDEGCDCVDNDVQGCGTHVGVCTRGSQTCVGGRWLDCAGAVQPGAERCNALDDDCDGAVDEGVTPPPCPLQAGVCAGAARRCLGAAGFAAGCGAAEYGPTYAPNETDAHCDGVDNDCDGRIDEACECQPDGPRPLCGTDVGACRSGRLRCVAGRFGECEGAIAPGAEVCDGVDNDCDGRVDEGLDAPLCPLQAGVCADRRQICGGVGGWRPCDAEAYGARYAAEETVAHCDGLDNDCDGRFDEACPPPPLVISELLYDSNGPDGPDEFIELAGPPGTPLAGVVIEAVNGDGGAVYRTIPLGGQIAFNGHFLVVEAGGPNRLGARDVLRDIADLVAVGADLQNGPDSVRLVWNGDTVLDALGYGTFGPQHVFAGEGEPAPGVTGGSLTRDALNSDTDDNRADFTRSADTPLRVPTPRGAPLPRIHLALRWAEPTADLDLHLQREGGRWRSEDDCYWGNRAPPWGPGGERGDPRLDRDATGGPGPEFIDYVTPPPGRYLVQVQFFNGAARPATPATVGVFIDGDRALELTAVVSSPLTYWAVAEILVSPDGSAVALPVDLASDTPFDN